ncbi:hypothetical protein JTE90_025167 [Oedothorax gibbosus]|uniref:Enhancer of mRNA-decapping protein 4 C-terminal domain-containing protein n=1 Tax=Oedothorax gibbosus TaxID=931172 RepID=A0AAV6UK08_9ARAC|nr:hypothetical protein JTE90_025167 [Oedothorax gibbosus]
MSEDGSRHSDRELVLLSDQISATFSNKLENTLKQELTSNVVPQINRVLDTIAQKMQLDFSQKLSSTDASLRDSITKYLKGKAFMDSLSQSLSGPLQGNVHTICKDVFQSSVVPSFEKACHNLFMQLNDQFTKGTLEYVQYLEKHASKSCSSIDNLLAQVREEIPKLVTEAQQKTQAQMTATMHNVTADMMKQQREVLLQDVRHVVQEELHKQALQQSRASTPVPHVQGQMDKEHLKQQIKQLVRQDNVEEAFRMALSAMNVQLVLFLCESVSVDRVFGPTPCPLEQHVLLSLLNQLPTDLAHKTDIKVSYIDEVIPSLDVDNPITKVHLKGVLLNLQESITNFLEPNPTHRLARKLKRISLAVDALLNK